LTSISDRPDRHASPQPGEILPRRGYNPVDEQPPGGKYFVEFRANEPDSWKIPLFERAKAIDRKQHVRINDQIRVSTVRVVSNEGTQLGILSTDEALGIARDAGLDLVEVAPNEKPPVCRVMDFGKYKYQQRKKQHNGKVHHTKIKEIRLRPKTGEHDVSFKVKQAKMFLQNRDKVQISVVFRGREIVHVDEGRRVIQQVIEMLDDVGKVEIAPSQQGRRIVCTVAPR
jgi:translation initiation factor IF-3